MEFNFEKSFMCIFSCGLISWQRGSTSCLVCDWLLEWSPSTHQHHCQHFTSKKLELRPNVLCILCHLPFFLCKRILNLAIMYTIIHFLFNKVFLKVLNFILSQMLLSTSLVFSLSLSLCKNTCVPYFYVPSEKERLSILKR